jgi:hypothetical protein
MRDFLIVLLIILLAASHAQHVREIRNIKGVLRDQALTVQYLTHPKVMQDRYFEWFHGEGEFGGGAKK